MEKKPNIFRRIVNLFPGVDLAFNPRVNPSLLKRKTKTTGITGGYDQSNAQQQQSQGQDIKQNLTAGLLPLSVPRVRSDINSWRASVLEAELPFIPYRVKQQVIYNDILTNGAVKSCVQYRKGLTKNRNFKFGTIDTNNKITQVNDDVTEFFNKMWFRQFVEYTLDSIFFGYSLISLGDVIDNEFKKISVIRRFNISPDRLIVSTIPYNTSGYAFTADPYAKSHVWITTPNTLGVASNVGYGLFYDVALYEIYLRNAVAFNMDYAELFASPLRVGKTDVKSNVERGAMAQMLDNMGSQAWAVVDREDSIDFMQANSNGKDTFNEFIAYLEGNISRLLLGHEDVLKSTPGKLGSSQGKSDDGMPNSPMQIAIDNIMNDDSKFVEYVVNDNLIPKLRQYGLIDIPDDCVFRFDNDNNIYENMNRNADLLTKWSTIIQQLSSAGYTLNDKFISDNDIPIEKSQVQDNGMAPNDIEKNIKDIQNLYEN